jgi:hypothetical protein
MCPSGASVKMFTARGSFMDKFLMPVHNSAKTDGLSFHEFRNVVYNFRKDSTTCITAFSAVSRRFRRVSRFFGAYMVSSRSVWDDKKSGVQVC